MLSAAAAPTDFEASIRRSRQILLVGGAITLALLIGASGMVVRLHQDARETMVSNLRRLGVVMAEQVARTVQGADLVLQDLVERIESAGVADDAQLRAGFGTRAAYEALGSHDRDLPQVDTLTVIDSAGRMVNLTRS